MNATWLLLLSCLACCRCQYTGREPLSIDPLLMASLCRNFTHGWPRQQQFFSPQWPANYPKNVDCIRVITATSEQPEVSSNTKSSSDSKEEQVRSGGRMFVRIDFRDDFRMEPPNSAAECEYDYLEVRDGEHGYSPLIGKYCGSTFPPMITSSGKSLWLRFSSDDTIEYSGFRAQYTFIETQHGVETVNGAPDIGDCVFDNVGDGHQAFVGTANISEERLEHANIFDLPLDCVWTLKAATPRHQIYLQFPKYELAHPNDCHLNYIQVFDGKTNEEHRLGQFCGSVAESLTSKTDTIFVRFYAEKSGLTSDFVAIFTAIRVLQPDEDACVPEEEYDCDDATCISPALECNGIRNCKFGWDEENCDGNGDDSAEAGNSGQLSLNLADVNVLSVLVMLFILITGLCAGMVWNVWRKVKLDQEFLAASRVKAFELPDVAGAPISSPTSGGGGGGGGKGGGMHRPGSKVDTLNGGCYVPDGGYAFNDMQRQSSARF